MKRNILLVFVLMLISVITASLFGGIISRYIYPFGGDWIVPQEIIYFINSFPFVYLFWTPLIFNIWGLNKKYVWIIILILPIIALDFYMGAIKFTWFWSIAFFVSGIILAKLINFIISKIRRPNPPMIISE